MRAHRKLAVALGAILLGAVAVVTTLPARVFSHCQIPCGIYNDEARFTAMAEDIATVEKSMKQIKKLSTSKAPNYNQIVRWVMNKDEHAEKISETATYYFLAQRVKPVGKDQGKAYDTYIAKLTLLHHVVFYAMKAKQTTDLENVRRLRSAFAAFKTVHTHAQ